MAADDTNALEHHLRKVGAVETAHSPAPTAAADHPLTDGERADFLVKLMSHARLHLLYLAEKLQEQTVAPEGAVAGSYGQTQSQVTHLPQPPQPPPRPPPPCPPPAVPDRLYTVWLCCHRCATTGCLLITSSSVCLFTPGAMEMQPTF